MLKCQQYDTKIWKLTREPTDMKQNSSINILPCAEFKDGQHPYPKMNIQAAEIRFGDDTHKNITLCAEYDTHMRLVILCSVPKMVLLTANDQADASFKLRSADDPTNLFLMKTQGDSEGGSSCTLTPMQSPMLLTIAGDAVEIEAVLLNGPEILWSNQKLVFEHDQHLITMREFPKTAEVRKQKETLKRDYIATGTVTLIRKDGGPIKPSDALDILKHFDGFLTFVRGAHCGIGHIIGKTKSGSVAYTYLEFLRMDQFQITTGWCDMIVVTSLPEVYRMYNKTVSRETDTNPILTTIAFYRDANIIRETSLEMAIVASHTALETIVPHILKSRAGWSENLIKKQISFHDKLRTAVAFIGIQAEPLEYSDALRVRSKEHNNADAFELISIFRNRITHQGKPFIYSGKELVEIWTVSQWLCEMFLFYMIGYRGQINDRRQYQGWRGEMIKPIPLPNRSSEIDKS